MKQHVHIRIPTHNSHPVELVDIRHGKYYGHNNIMYAMTITKWWLLNAKMNFHSHKHLFRGEKKNEETAKTWINPVDMVHVLGTHIKQDPNINHSSVTIIILVCVVFGNCGGKLSGQWVVQYLWCKCGHNCLGLSNSVGQRAVVPPTAASWPPRIHPLPLHLQEHVVLSVFDCELSWPCVQTETERTESK